MAELRKDPLSNRWVIISKDRSARPVDSTQPVELPVDAQCPFCEGNEEATPPELFSIREGHNPDRPGWLVRVVPNKFPALKSDRILARWGEGLYDAVSGIGSHEVIIESPQHIPNMADFEANQISEIFKTYRHRLISLFNDKRFRYVMIFKNYKQAAGATLMHPHSQIIALPIVPSDVKTELEAAKIYYSRKERCMFCDILNEELSSGKRLICQSDKFVAFTPYASRFPFQIMVMPRIHNYSFTHESDDSLKDLSLIIKQVLTRLKNLLGDPAYNIILHTSPNLLERPGNNNYWTSIKYDYHWYLEIIPRITKVAGFEWGTGFYINPTPPEEAAEFLRNVEI